MNGKKHGQGILTCVSGQKVSQEWVDGQKVYSAKVPSESPYKINKAYEPDIVSPESPWKKAAKYVQ
jgi:hypothetical protein